MYLSKLIFRLNNFSSINTQIYNNILQFQTNQYLVQFLLNYPSLTFGGNSVKIGSSYKSLKISFVPIQDAYKKGAKRLNYHLGLNQTMKLATWNQNQFKSISFNKDILVLQKNKEKTSTKFLFDISNFRKQFFLQNKSFNLLQNLLKSSLGQLNGLNFYFDQSQKISLKNLETMPIQQHEQEK